MKHADQKHETVQRKTLWELCLQEGQEAMARGDWATAEQVLREGIAEVDRLHRHDPRKATGLRHLAQVLHQLGRADEAEACIVEALRIMEYRIGNESRGLLKLLGEYADLLEHLGRGELATEARARIARLAGPHQT